MSKMGKPKYFSFSKNDVNPFICREEKMIKKTENLENSYIM